jgi:hypothetical protein
MTRAITPAVIPRIEMVDITDTIVCLRFARRYRRATNSSNFIGCVYGFTRLRVYALMGCCVIVFVINKKRVNA